MPAGKVMKILLLCTGNTCRSPMAEGLFKEFLKERGLDAQVVSAGLFALDGDTASPQAITAMGEKGIDISKHRARQVTKDLVEESDLILTMTSEHKKRLLTIIPEAKKKVFTLKEFGQGEILDIKDPFGQPVEVYKESAKEIEGALKGVICRLLENGWEF